METACPPRRAPPTAERPNPLGRRSLHRLPDGRMDQRLRLPDHQVPPLVIGIEELTWVGRTRGRAFEVRATEASLEVDRRAAPQGARYPRARGGPGLGRRWRRHRATGIATRGAALLTATGARTINTEHGAL